MVILGLLLFGPKKLPEIGRKIGRIMIEFKRASQEFQNQLNEEVRQFEQEVSDPTPTILPPAGITSREEAPLYTLEPDSGDHPGDEPAHGSNNSADAGEEISSKTAGQVPNV